MSHNILYLTCIAVFFIFSLMAPGTAVSQAGEVRAGLEEGIHLQAPDSSAGLHFGFRLQQQLAGVLPLEDDGSHLPPGFQTRRARLRLKGFLLEGKVTWFTQFAWDRGQPAITNALISWHPGSGQTLGVGQSKVFEDRQNRFSSSRFQLVERAQANRLFTYGYDIGIFWTGDWSAPDAPGFKAYISLTNGELRNRPAARGGYLYTGRVELLPLGSFRGKGDYTASTLMAEPEPRLSIGLAATYNQDAHTLYGNNIDNFADSDVTSYHADFLFKNGYFSVMGEWYNRDVENEVLGLITIGPGPVFPVLISDLRGGEGFFLQAGQRVAERFEIAVRVEGIGPTNLTSYLPETDERRDLYTLGGTWFGRGHHLKVQGDVTLVDRINRLSGDHFRHLLTQLQLQVNF